jgi:hypothetical protein
LYANRESVRGYAEAYRNGERISTAHVESTVNQLINWRMCKKHQMGCSRAGAQQLLHVKTAIINGRDWTGIPGIIQYQRISPPDPQVFTGLDLSAEVQSDNGGEEARGMGPEALSASIRS